MAEIAHSPNYRGVAEPPSEPASRGTLTVKDKVVRRLAVQAVLDTPGVERYAAVLDKLTGRELPRVDVQLSRDHVRAAVDIAVTWPVSLPGVTSAVRTNVARALAGWADLVVDGVDVNVTAILTDGDTNSSSGESTIGSVQ